MADVAEVCNIALLEVGSEPIADIDQQIDRARYIKARFPIARDLTMRAHPWNFAMRRDLIAVAGTPAFGWSYAYNLPNDPVCLRVWEIGERPAKDIPHTIEGRQLLTNMAGPLPIRFIGRIIDASLWDPLYCQALGLHLAHSVCFKLTSNLNLEASLRKKALDFLRLAQSIDGQEGTSDDEYEGDLLASRI